MEKVDIWINQDSAWREEGERERLIWGKQKTIHTIIHQKC